MTLAELSAALGREVPPLPPHPHTGEALEIVTDDAADTVFAFLAFGNPIVDAQSESGATASLALRDGAWQWIRATHVEPKRGPF